MPVALPPLTGPLMSRPLPGRKPWPPFLFADKGKLIQGVSRLPPVLSPCGRCVPGRKRWSPPGRARATGGSRPRAPERTCGSCCSARRCKITRNGSTVYFWSYTHTQVLAFRSVGGLPVCSRTYIRLLLFSHTLQKMRKSAENL